MRHLIISILALLPAQAFACEQFRNGVEIIDFIEEKRSFVLVNSETHSVELFHIYGTGTDTNALMAMADIERGFRYDHEDERIVRLDDTTYRCAD